MLSRKPALVLGSYTCCGPHAYSGPHLQFPHLYSQIHPLIEPRSKKAFSSDSSLGSSTSCRPLARVERHPRTPSRAHIRTTRNPIRTSTRTYAQHAAPSDDDGAWPEPTVPHRSPTPYQILRCEPGRVYTKHRFYRLVKIYHPDHCTDSSPIAHLPPAVRLERYRQLVAAHTILSDDAKRQAYDLWGAGWAGHHQSHMHSPQHAWASEQRQWTHDPRQNATWEDWERWYKREHGTENMDERTMHLTNVAFVSLIFTIVTLGGIMQGTRASMLTTSAMEQSQKIHREASMELARSKRATLSGDRNERIRTFLEHREAVHAGEEAYHRLLPPADACTTDTVRKH